MDGCNARMTYGRTGNSEAGWYACMAKLLLPPGSYFVGQTKLTRLKRSKIKLTYFSAIFEKEKQTDQLSSWLIYM